MTKNKFTGIEKRAYLRVSSRCVLIYTILTKNLKPLIDIITKSHTDNICAGGIKFVVRKKMPVHTIVEFQLRIPKPAICITGLGEITRIKPRAKKRSYDVGLRFLWVPPKSAELIDAYVRGKKIQEIIKKIRKS